MKRCDVCKQEPARRPALTCQGCINFMLELAKTMRQHPGVDLCIRGHPRTEENTYRAPRGSYTCRPCQNQLRRERLRKKKHACPAT